jgi:hypothetical protein
LHAITLPPTILVVKTARTVWKNVLSSAGRGHASQFPRAPVGAGAPPYQPVVTQTTRFPLRHPREAEQIRKPDRTTARGAPRLRASRSEKLAVRYLATIRIAAINE